MCRWRNRVGLTVCVAAASLAYPGCSGNPPLSPYGSAKQGFHVLMPGGKARVTSETGRNGMECTVHAAGDSDGEIAVIHYDWPIPFTESVAQKTMRRDIDQVVEAYGGHGVSSKPFTLPTGQTGLEYQANITKPRAGKVRGRTIIDGTRVYNALVVGTADKVDSADATKFLDSFEVTK